MASITSLTPTPRPTAPIPLSGKGDVTDFGRNRRELMACLGLEGSKDAYRAIITHPVVIKYTEILYNSGKQRRVLRKDCWNALDLMRELCLQTEAQRLAFYGPDISFGATKYVPSFHEAAYNCKPEFIACVCLYTDANTESLSSVAPDHSDYFTAFDKAFISNQDHVLSKDLWNRGLPPGLSASASFDETIVDRYNRIRLVLAQLRAEVRTGGGGSRWQELWKLVPAWRSTSARAERDSETDTVEAPKNKNELNASTIQSRFIPCTLDIIMSDVIKEAIVQPIESILDTTFRKTGTVGHPSSALDLAEWRNRIRITHRFGDFKLEIDEITAAITFGPDEEVAWSIVIYDRYCTMSQKDLDDFLQHEEVVSVLFGCVVAFEEDPVLE
ncbi:hypothetical protein LTR78_001038 [Recurvomyces mirabilis]|uniref:Uncharacterized protein n=1 Tax=Recurvomyces mirabilis TaxID=574656 RepID=A0AAE1C624_9PEZI|nr:hypothetical protein LTR78_001038 [Recurvomyces mirabilis]KAK5159010.1 hypothetical protein LTS14_003118 [Recurvomyces mirabilis]